MSAAGIPVAIDGDAARGVFYASAILGRWNGWARPAFPLAEAQRLAATLEAGALSFAGEFVREADQDGGHLVRPTLVDGVPCYAIGDGWVWLEVDGAEDGAL